VSSSLFERTGCLFVNPGGNLEHPESWGHVIEWAALNIGAEAAHDPDWVRMRHLCAQAGVAAFPWLHVRRMGDLDRLLAKANSWGTRLAGVNVEDVLGDNLSVPAIAAQLRQWGGDALIIVLPWLPNGQGWGALREHPFAIEYFPYDPSWNHIFDNRAALVEHACSEIGDGAMLSFLYGTYPPEVARPDGSPPYDLSAAHSFYTGDDIGSSPTDWAKWDYDGATSYVPCPHHNGGMTPIGPNDGIAAGCNRLRDLDPQGTLLVKTGGKWPPLSSLSTVPLDQWKAWDKLQRTLQILKDDHDAAH
jgi:hypothetical protein